MRFPNVFYTFYTKQGSNQRINLTQRLNTSSIKSLISSLSRKLGFINPRNNAVFSIIYQFLKKKGKGIFQPIYHIPFEDIQPFMPILSVTR